jgi:ferric-dicitrate binding protein FerR (iron transport regulator)
MRDRDRLSQDDAALELLRLAGRRNRVPADLQARVDRTVRDHWHRKVAMRRRWRWAVATASLAAAATLVVAVLVPRLAPTERAASVARVEVLRGEVACLHQSMALALRQGAVVPAATTVSTGPGGRAALRLSNGASLRLDHGTRVELRTSTNLQLVSGAVYVDSGPEPRGAGLVVASALGEVSEVGTQFEVRLLAHALRVQVREGSVGVRQGPKSHAVSPGEQVLLAADGSLSRTPMAGTASEWSWVLEVAPPFDLEGRSAAAYLEWVTRETGLELRWAPPNLAREAQEMTLHGDISAVRPDATLDLVLPTCGLTHRRENGTLVVGGSLTE